MSTVLGLSGGQSPCWITQKADGYINIGAELCTKNGRVAANAIVIDVVVQNGQMVMHVISDTGEEVGFLSIKRCKELYYRPNQAMDINRHPGVRLWRQSGA